tara:strand:- start:693 stop:2828 length:2136 start_codon:yes stop_codon:yes gene_type:complete
MKNNIAILLPYKDQFIKNNAGSASIWIKDFSKISKFKKLTTVFGYTANTNKIFDDFRYVNLKFSNFGIQSKNLQYVNKFIEVLKKKKFSLIEIHNRPSYILHIEKYLPDNKYILIIHNNPQTLRGAVTAKERKRLLKLCSKITFVSNWVKEKFFEGLDIKNHEKCQIIYPAINKVLKFPKKEKIVTFVGKLNHSKGYDTFGRAIVKILKKYRDWKSIVIGDEPREKYNFKHERLIHLGWITHDETLNIYKKSSISVVPSHWEEPFGRTSLEAASRGCATILSRRGGLPETIPHGVYLNRITQNEIYKKIKQLILNKKFREDLQRKSLTHVFHDIKKNTKVLDSAREEIINEKNIFVNRNISNLKILNISNFGSRQFNRLYYISIAKKLANGFIRNGHDVINLSDRDVGKYNKSLGDFKGKKYLNTMIYETAKNYKPDLILLGHSYGIQNETIEKIKDYSKKTIISQWFEDHLADTGPDYLSNRKKLLKYDDFITSNFITTHPSTLNFLKKKKNFHYLPIPVDKNIEKLKIYENKNQICDVFFSMSHGVNRGKLKRDKEDERHNFISDLITQCPNIIFDIYGYKNREPVWAEDFYKVIVNSKMALNLTRGKPIKYLTSNRIASLIGNGLLTFIDKKTKLDNFFNRNEVIFYSNLQDLAEKINRFKGDDKARMKIARNGRKKYFKLFECQKISDYIVSKSFNRETSKQLKWMD